MLFNSSLFLLGFLPVSLLTYFAARKVSLHKFHLLIASAIFYAYWDVRFVPLLLGSIVCNWLTAELALRRAFCMPWTILGIGFNLTLLGIFKYANFFSGTFSDLGLVAPRHWDIVLPLAISFFTFHQISYLADIAKGMAPHYRFLDYAVYVLFFPHLIAGPIVRHNEFIFQLEKPPPLADVAFRSGAVLLVFGLVKKVWLADPLSQIVNPMFATAALTPLGASEAWLAMLGFALQIYFDFSGYTDMAIGMSLMFGYVLPQNFDAPYRAPSLIDFWRRWHMTLSRYLRDYLYIPLGGNRHGEHRRSAAILVTMLLGGLWHGANWTFVVWGGLHGLGLVGNHLYRNGKYPMPQMLSQLVTFLFVAICFVIFRATSLPQAWNIIGSLAPTKSLGPMPEFANIVLVLAALVLSTFGPTNHQLAFDKRLPSLTSPAVLVLCFVLSVVVIIDTAHYSPFIYFQF
jgi:alginate O-acetyltransferase complex protein AlgI